MRILPAILTSDPNKLRTMLSQAQEFTNRVQIDIMDGYFVPSKSITAQHLKEVPTGLELEIHLMTLHPEELLLPFKEAGAKRIIFHWEATPKVWEVIEKARALSLSPGIALNPDTPWEEIMHILSGVDFVLFLSVYPGFYGREFIPRVLEKARQFKRLYPEKEAGIDGGIKKDNIVRVKAAGLDYACVGSSIFYGDPKENYLELVKRLEASQ